MSHKSTVTMEAEHENCCGNKDILKSVLIEAYECRKYFLQPKFKSSVTIKDEKNAWALMLVSVTSLSTVRRTAGEIRRKWTKLTSEAKSYPAKRKCLNTGGGSKTATTKKDLLTGLISNLLT